MSFENKYLKYKIKYNNLKQSGGQFIYTNMLYEEINKMPNYHNDNELITEHFIEYLTNLNDKVYDFKNKLEFLKEIMQKEGGAKK
jgi:hypothetical protein